MNKGLVVAKFLLDCPPLSHSVIANFFLQIDCQKSLISNGLSNNLAALPLLHYYSSFTGGTSCKEYRKQPNFSNAVFGALTLIKFTELFYYFKLQF